MKRIAAAIVVLLAATLARADDRSDAAQQQLMVMLRLPPAHFRADGSYGGGYGAPGQSARRALAAALARAHGLALVDDWPLPLLGVDCYVLVVPAPSTPERAAELLARDDRVAWAQPMNVYRGQSAAAHDDALYQLQPAASAWHLAALHGVATGRGVKVAVVDSGVDASHPDLTGQVSVIENHVDAGAVPAERHGTAVAGIIAARADDGVGVAGVAPQARLLALRGCWQDAAGATLCTSLGLAKALASALQHGAAVVNLSVGGPPDRLLARLLDLALARGTAIVAAGNGFPASHPGVVAVGNAPPALWAPGRDVPAPVPGARWDFVSGDSYAAAHVSGLLALLAELGGAQVLVLDAGGRIDACATLQRAAGRFGVCAATPLAARP